MNLKSQIHLVISLRMLSFHLVSNEYSNNNYSLKNPVGIAIKKCEQHPSINLIKENITNEESFHFLPTE